MSIIPQRKIVEKLNKVAKARQFREVIKLAQDPQLTYSKIAEMMANAGHRMPNGKVPTSSYIYNLVVRIRSMESKGTLDQFLKDN